MINVPSHFKVVNLIWDLHMMCCIVMVFILSISILIFCYSNLQWKCTRRFCAGCHILANQKPTDNQGVHSLTSTKEVKLHSFDSFLKLSRNFSEAPFSVIWKAIYKRTKDKNTQKSYVYKYTCVGVFSLYQGLLLCLRGVASLRCFPTSLSF